MSFLQSLQQSVKSDRYGHVYTLVNGEHQTVGNQRVFVESTGSTQITINGVRLLQNNTTVIASVTGPQVASFSKVFETDMFRRRYAYRDIKTDLNWQAIYGVETKPWPFQDPESGVKSEQEIEVVYCRQCGILLPYQLVSIDHQGPQSNGEAKAMCRFFRALGCTRATGMGNKSQVMQGFLAGWVGGTTLPVAGSKRSRYTLSEIGTIYYSLIRKAGLFDQFKDACMHSGFNLRPVCSRCNSSLGNSSLI